MRYATIWTKRCIQCGMEGYIDAPEDEIKKYENGAHVQDAFPDMSYGDREQIVTGTHSECWSQLFGRAE